MINYIPSSTKNKEKVLHPNRTANGLKPLTYEWGSTGFDDIRVFELNNKIHYLCSSRVYNQKFGMVIIDENMVPHPLKYGEDKTQKNWSPLIKNGILYLVYSYDPFIVLKCEYWNDYLIKKVKETKPLLDLTNFRGGSKFIEAFDGYLTIIHEVFYSNGRRFYYHRFVFVDKELNLTKVSNIFYFVEKNIEYGCGLEKSIDGKNIYITFGVNDREARIICVELEKVENMLERLEDI